MNTDKIYDLLGDLKESIKNVIFNNKNKEEIIYEMAKILDRKLVNISDEIDKNDTKDRIIKALGDDVFICKRSWDAWSLNTMTEEDFELASENDDLIEQLR